MRNVLIAGQHSFIGTAVERRLAAFPDEYAATSLDMHGEDWKSFDFSPFDCVVHVAGIAHVSPKPEMRPLYEAINRDLAVACARRAREMGAKQFLYLSSAIVFGDAAPAGEAGEITPETSPSPANAYGRSKLEAEHGLRALENGRFRVAILRPMMVFGQGCKGNYNALAALARRAPLFPDFPNRRGVVYIDDLAELIRRLIDEGAAGTFHPQTFAVSTADIARAVAKAHGRRVLFTRALDPLLRAMGGSGTVRRAFGGFFYREDMADHGFAPGALSLEDCVARTEEGHG